MTRDELIEQAAKTQWDASRLTTQGVYWVKWQDAGPDTRAAWMDVVRNHLDVLEPLIREQVAKDLEAADGVDGWYFARIARGES